MVHEYMPNSYVKIPRIRFIRGLMQQRPKRVVFVDPRERLSDTHNFHLAVRGDFDRHFAQVN